MNKKIKNFYYNKIKNKFLINIYKVNKIIYKMNKKYKYKMNK